MKKWTDVSGIHVWMRYQIGSFIIRVNANLICKKKSLSMQQGANQLTLSIVVAALGIAEGSIFEMVE